jgi:hypothetical protein
MQKETLQDEIVSLGDQLNLPPQAAPVNRAMTGSAITAVSGVEPSRLFPIPPPPDEWPPGWPPPYF